MWIYIQWFWIQIVMVSPGTHLVKNIESQSRNNESQIKNIYTQVCNWKCLGLCVTRQLICLISLTDSKTLYYCSTLKLKYSPSKGSRKYASFNNSHNNCHRIHRFFTVDPVLSSHHQGITKSPLNTGWLPNTGYKKYSSKNLISSADQIRSLTSNRNIHFRRFNDLRK